MIAKHVIDDAGGLSAALGASGGRSTFLGQNISFSNPSLTNPYMQRWQFAVQQATARQVTARIVVRGKSRDAPASNAGSRSDSAAVLQHAAHARPGDHRPAEFARSPTRSTCCFRGPTWRQLRSRFPVAAPYPQFTGITATKISGFSWYHALQMRFEKRLSSGLSAQYSFTWSKFMQATSYLDPTDAQPEKVISDLDRPFRHVVACIYELPLGQGKSMRVSSNKAVSTAVSGWQVQGVFTYQSGQALGFGDALLLPGETMADVVLPAGQRSVAQWFNVAAFNRNSSQQLASNIVTLSSAFSGVRAPVVNNWDLSALKNTRIKENWQLQFAAQFINALNHAQFTAPDHDADEHGLRTTDHFLTTGNGLSNSG
jgi:hypothetical protein